MECTCGHTSCRQTIRPSDANLLYRRWDRTLRSAIRAIPFVEQPLLSCLAPHTRISLDQHLSGISRYRSVRSLIRKTIAPSMAS